MYKFKTDIPAFLEKQQKSHHKTLNRLDKQQKEKSKQYTDNKRNGKLIHISKNDIVLAKDIYSKNKVSTYYETNLYIVTKVYKRSARIKNNKGEHVQGKADLQVLQRDRSKVDIQRSKKAELLKANIKPKQPHTFHISYHIPFVHLYLIKCFFWFIHYSYDVIVGIRIYKYWFCYENILIILIVLVLKKLVLEKKIFCTG